jgi:hypothetical protein
MKRHIQPAVKEPHGSARSYEGWQCYQALVSAAGRAMYDQLLAQASERLPAHLLATRRLAVPTVAAAAAPQQRRAGGGGGGGGGGGAMGSRVAVLLAVTPQGRVRLSLHLLLPSQGKAVKVGERPAARANGEALDVDGPAAAAAAAAGPGALATPQQVAAAALAEQGKLQEGRAAQQQQQQLTATALLGAGSSRQADAMIKAALAGAWREDSDVGLTLAALAQLFGEPFLALLPSSVLPGALL